VRWRPVLWGFFINFCFALIILKTRAGLATFEFVGDKVTNFLAFTDEGSSFVFGSDYTKHYFAFKVSRDILFIPYTSYTPHKDLNGVHACNDQN